jgi:hypothetical protein
VENVGLKPSCAARLLRATPLLTRLDARANVADVLLHGSLGWVVPVAVAIPNVVWAVFPARERQPVHAATSGPVAPKWVEWVERVGQVSVFVLPFLYRFDLVSPASLVALGLMGLALAFYYLGWLRYFLCGRRPEMLYRSLLGVPLPLSVSPVAFFLASSFVLRSVPLAIASLAFGGAHVVVSRTAHGRLSAADSAGGDR